MTDDLHERAADILGRYRERWGETTFKGPGEEPQALIRDLDAALTTERAYHIVTPDGRRGCEWATFFVDPTDEIAAEREAHAETKRELDRTNEERRSYSKRFGELGTENYSLREALQFINRQECDCSENQNYFPACPHTIAMIALSAARKALEEKGATPGHSVACDYVLKGKP